MGHPICRVVSFEIVGRYTLRVTFDDGSTQVIDFSPVLRGELFGQLQDLALFNQIRADLEAHTLVWLNGADFDPATLHDWPEHIAALSALARRWGLGAAWSGPLTPAFHPRCPFPTTRCRAEVPRPLPADGALVACHGVEVSAATTIVSQRGRGAEPPRVSHSEPPRRPLCTAEPPGGGAIAREPHCQ